MMLCWLEGRPPDARRDSPWLATAHRDAPVRVCSPRRVWCRGAACRARWVGV